MQPSRELAEKHYAVHKGKPFYDSLLQVPDSGPTVAMVWEGREAVTVARTLMGATDGTKAPPATIRGDFALSVQNNLVHGSDSPENAASGNRHVVHAGGAGRLYACRFTLGGPESIEATFLQFKHRRGRQPADNKAFQPGNWLPGGVHPLGRS